ncbi:MAG: zeta toxin family protein [Lachnospiraceae bacterium]|nr:zeta toxin family protein [Lachnospiraceae bacterium]
MRARGLEGTSGFTDFVFEVSGFDFQYYRFGLGSVSDMKNEIITYTLYAGPNGAGKTTLYKAAFVDPGEKRVNSDEILKENGGDWKNQKDQFHAMKEAARRIRTYINQGISFNQETTLAGKSIFGMIRKARECGYTINLYYIGLADENLAVRRVMERERNGGHGIPEEDIRRRYRSSMENLNKIIPLCDNIEIYDNTIKFYEVAKKINGIWMKFDEHCMWLSKNVQFDS